MSVDRVRVSACLTDGVDRVRVSACLTDGVDRLRVSACLTDGVDRALYVIIAPAEPRHHRRLKSASNLSPFNTN